MCAFEFIHNLQQPNNSQNLMKQATHYIVKHRSNAADDPNLDACKGENRQLPFLVYSRTTSRINEQA